VSDQHHGRYRDDGILVLRDLLSAGELATIDASITSMIEAARGAAESHPYSFDPGRAGDPEALRRIFAVIDHDERLGFLLEHRGVLDAASACVGPDVVFHSAKVVCKPSGSPHTAPWHQDLAFFNHSNAGVVTLSVHLDDFSDGQGALVLARGSHCRGLQRHARGRLLAAEAERCQLEAQVMAVSRGETTVHHCLTSHRAQTNESGRLRRRLLLVFRAADAQGLEEPLPSLYGRHHGRLLRGVDRPPRWERFEFQPDVTAPE
jgi:ectoine hydroxylase